MPECLKCHSQRVSSGSIVTPTGTGLVVFRPEGLKFFAVTAYGGTEIAVNGCACLDCGLVWSSTPPDRLTAFIEKNCTPESKP